MSSLNFPIKPRTILVADASVVINLNATGRAHDIITALPMRYAVTENARAELSGGTRNGHDDARKLQALLDDGFVDLVRLGHTGNGIYESLVEGSALRTLDDGEAATIGYAYEIGGAAMIDERKARNLCVDRFPELQVVSTIDLLLHEIVAGALGRQGQIDAIINALQLARMRVPPDQVNRVVTLIGDQSATSCRSLPKAARAAS
jgi:predicted nucleic acid-binding protein